tara:strand:+ start:2388 stop:2912 length:525 start_codon:yes stop_codon:yes gene_type:complete
MANAAAARPGTALGNANNGSITGAIITSDATQQGDADDVFLIKTTSATFNFSVAVVETTGSGDTRTTFDHGDKVLCDFQLTGVMVATKAPGIQKLVKQRVEGTDAGTVTNDIKIDFVFSGTAAASGNSQSFQAMPCIIQQMQIQHDPKQPVVGIALAGKMMCAAADDFIGAQTT